MNIYFLDQNPWTAAQSVHDRHLSSGIADAAQCLSTVWWKRWSKATLLTQNAHVANFGVNPGLKYLNSPLVNWAEWTTGNYAWAIEYLRALITEKKCRFPKEPPHKLADHDWLKGGLQSQRDKNLSCPPGLLLHPFTCPPQLVADVCQRAEEDFVEAYRAHYKYFNKYYARERRLDNSKLHLSANSWTNRGQPAWLV